jgi:predicted ATPase
VCGEAGIGKSRLIAEAKAEASAPGFLLLQGSCFQVDSSYPYAPLLDLLRASAVPTPEAPDPIILEFARLLPEQELQLLPLSRSDVDAMLDAMFALQISERANLLDLIYPLTEGNPFFVEEILTSSQPQSLRKLAREHRTS